jgi:epoxyqueuosine reductase
LPDFSSLKRTLTAEALSLGFDALGVCGPAPAEGWEFYRQWLARGFHGGMGYLAGTIEARRCVDSLLPGCRSVVAVAINYNQPNPAVPGAPRIARYALGRDYHKTIRGKLRRLARFLEAEAPGARTRVCVDSAPVLERELAHRAGLGWFGKNTMLIDSRRGSWFLLGIMLTDVELPRDEPSLGGCGDCRLCVDACPAGCIVFEGGRWQVDARLCVSALTVEHRGPFTAGQAASVAGWTFGCDACQEVCPFNQPRPSQPLRARETSEPDFLARREWPPVPELATIGYAEWDALTRGSAVRRAGHAGLRRNARANLEGWRRKVG